MLYRILTEDKNYERVKELVCQYFDGATFIKADGVWKNEMEQSLIIEINTSSRIERSKIGRLCNEIKNLNQQDAILVQTIAVESTLI